MTRRSTLVQLPGLTIRTVSRVFTSRLGEAQTRVPLLAFAAAVIGTLACGGSSSTSPASKVSFTATLLPANEPSVAGDPTGSGNFTATFDASTNIFTWNAQFSGLSSNVIAGHIHGPFVPGGDAASAGELLSFAPSATPGASFIGLNTAMSGSATGSVVLTSATQFIGVNGDSLKKLLLAGLTYVNIYTAANRGGEIRGQIAKE